MFGKKDHWWDSVDKDILGFVIEKHEKELKKRMTPEEFDKYSEDIAKHLFTDWVSNIPNSDFKQFCLDNFEIITGSEEEFNKAMQEEIDRRLDKLKKDPEEGGEND